MARLSSPSGTTKARAPATRRGAPCADGRCRSRPAASSVGAYYLLIALGLSLIFSLGGIVNLAHGGFYAIGAYLAVLLAPRVGFAGAFIASPVLVGVLGMLFERFFFRRFYRSDPILSLLLTFGLAMVIEQSLRMIFGAAPLPFSIPPELRGQLFIGDFIYPRYRLMIFGVALAAVAATWFLVYRTAFGRVVRAGVQNPDMVGALGISLQPYMTAVAALGVGLAGLAGVLLAPITTTTKAAVRISAPIAGWTPEIGASSTPASPASPTPSAATAVM